MIDNPKMKQYAEWAARMIVAVVILLMTIGFNRLEESRETLENKLDKDVYDKHCDENREQFRQQALRNDEVLRLLMQIKTDITWIKKEQERKNGED